MARLTWKDNTVVSLGLKDGSFVLAQLLKSPYIAFFNAFQDRDEWQPSAAEEAEPLFFCAVARAFLKFSPLEKQPKVRPKQFDQLPKHWIRPFVGSRRITLWRGTSREFSMILLNKKPGGQLVEKHLDAVGPGNPPVIKDSIPLTDNKTIDSHEQDGIWLYPTLNERLYLCKTLGKNVDPDKDLAFDRPMKPEYATFIDILAQRGKPEDWGYSSTPYKE